MTRKDEGKRTIRHVPQPVPKLNISLGSGHKLGIARIKNRVRAIVLLPFHHFK